MKNPLAAIFLSIAIAALFTSVVMSILHYVDKSDDE